MFDANCEDAIHIGNQTTFFRSTDEINFRQVLREFHLENLHECLTSHGVTYRSLKYISKDDIKDAIPDLESRAEFREKLHNWRKEKFNIDDETVSVDSKVKLWLEKSTTNLALLSNPCQNELDVYIILDNCSKGKSIISYYAKHDKLLNGHREQIIDMIVEEAHYKGVKIKSAECDAIVNQIVDMFPNEVEAKEFYFTPRIGKKSPGGKLFSKYANMKTKRMKISNTAESTEIAPLENQYQKTEGQTGKPAPKVETVDWATIMDRWNYSYNLRNKNVVHLEPSAFVKEWLKYSDRKVSFPDRHLLLLNKWAMFRKKIERYYRANIQNPNCKQLLMDLQIAENMDSKDYILAALLPSVLPPITWYEGIADLTRIKVTLPDVQESFVFRLNSLNDHEKKITELLTKHTGNANTIHPFVVVEGEKAYDVKSFFVYFEKTLHKSTSFIECLDICYKIYSTLNLKYPLSAQMPWIFIQNYFYEVTSFADAKSANLTALLEYMKN